MKLPIHMAARDASYTTQPLELLNALSFENPRGPTVLDTDSEGNTDNRQFDVGDNGQISPLASPSIRAHGSRGNPNAMVLHDHSQEFGLQSNLDGSEGLPSPSGRAQKPADASSLQRSQTIGQKIMGNMMDNLFLRSFTSKSRGRASDASAPSSPIKAPDAVEPDAKEEESPLMVTVRGKCITQLLLLGAIDSIQKKYWSKLRAPQKIAIMDVLLSMLEFAASYNSYSNLRMRMHHIPVDRPPLNLLRQELAGTSIYLDVLQKTTSGFDSINGKWQEDSSVDVVSTKHSGGEEKLEGIAEERLVSFCEQVLREASDLQSTVGETTNMDVHRVLELRSPIIVKVVKGMCFMNSKIFRRHLREFYPLLTKLVCCDQMDVRGALGDLFRVQLKALLPQ